MLYELSVHLDKYNIKHLEFPRGLASYYQNDNNKFKIEKKSLIFNLQSS